ncbi:hypothetical protein BDV96DRAFT_579001 [Lophiotrema nucula]|uniref:AA1-like domain-containing protein n=1 Tax=Lophiotrema nucula TaxID=690887 RepID=A0A6A5Z4Q8_9PLEO|nr:hypothetical protein BDV96DRAFT_579001 [Lophiotrema nucula]
MSTSKIFFAVLLSAANLVAAAPTDNNAAVANSLEKRVDPTFSKSSKCLLDMYPKLGQKAAMSNMMFLRGDLDEVPEQSVYVMQGTTTMVSCQGQAGVYLSVPADSRGNNNKLPFENSDLSKNIDTAYWDCFGGKPADDDSSIWAFQTFQTGYDVLVHGNANCDGFKQPS